MEAFGLEVEEELSTLATQWRAEGVWKGKRYHEQKEAWMQQVREVPMCETRDLCVKWLTLAHLDIRRRQKNRHETCLLKGCEENASATGQKQSIGRSGAVKHEHEELKEGVWLEPALALLRKKTKIETLPEHWSWKEAGCSKDFSKLVGRTKVNAKHAHKEEGTEKHRLYHCPEWYEVRREIPEAFRKWEQKAKDLKERVKVAKRYCRAPSQ